MKNPPVIAFLVGLLGTGLFTGLLIAHLISAEVYSRMMIGVFVRCIVIITISRLLEFDFQGFKVKLQEAREIKAELENLYADISHLKQSPLTLDDAMARELGGGGGMPRGADVMRYVSGCMRRERERLARIFIADRPPEKIGEAILDGSLDDKV